MMPPRGQRSSHPAVGSRPGNPEPETTYLHCMAQQADTDRDELLRQQRVLARFGEMALASQDLQEILTEASRLVGEALGTDLAKVVELQPDGQTLLVRAGVGWRPGIVGHMQFDLRSATPEGIALRSGAPIVSPDLAQEQRFQVLGFLADHGVRALVCVPIVGSGSQNPYGVLQVDAREPHPFGEAEIAFLTTYANMLASAVARLDAADELRQRSEDNERLLRELQHRVKNNLQVVVGLLEVQARQTRRSSAREALRAAGRRVEALRLLHNKLHVSGHVGRVDLSEYLAILAAGLLSFHEGEAARIRLVLDIERGVSVAPDVAAPIGLLVNEFVTNSFKHAFSERPGTIGIKLAMAQDACRLEIWDDGSGLPADTAAGRQPRTRLSPDGKVEGGGMGIRMIRSLARQLGATPKWGVCEGGRGTLLALTISRLMPAHADAEGPARMRR